MKREIKFRAWHKSECLMCDVTTLTNDGGYLVGVKYGPNQIIGRSIFYAPKDGRFCHFDEFELMQFTGLTDKNGKEIYEGDIIKGVHPKNNSVINWGKEYASFTIDSKGWAFSHYFHESCKPENIEVIGNIYENPELLK